MSAYKPVFKAGGTSLKDRKALAQKNQQTTQISTEQQNPWENLTTQANLINEDELMQEAGYV